MASISVNIKTNRSVDEVVKASRTEQAQELINWIAAIAGGNKSASLDLQISSADPVAASGTFTLVSAIATDAVAIGGVTFTGTDTPTLATHWDTAGADDAADAAALAAAINAHPVLVKIVTATSAAGVVTVRHKVKGLVGNHFPISSADETITASGAFLAGGTGGPEGTVSTFSFGL